MGMSDKKINEVLDLYAPKISEAIDMMMPPTDDAEQAFYEKLTHLLEMIPKMKKFLEEGRREKTFRWLGFIQGTLYAYGIYTIDEMANHSRPTKRDLREASPDHKFLDTDVGCSLCKEYAEAPA